MENKLNYTDIKVKVYHGYGNQDKLIIYGHVLKAKPSGPRKFTDSIFLNSIHLFKLFIVKPVPFVKVMLQWGSQTIFSTTAKDGFFTFEWKPEGKIDAGWHTLKVFLIDDENKKVRFGHGKVFVPNTTQYGFISDIDDTVLVSHSNTTGKKLRTMFTKNPRRRKTFADVVKFYKLLSLAHTDDSLLNPFFYVSSSEWNLYDDLNEFFKHNGLPKGAFLLNSLKRWYELLRIGKTNHEGKTNRVTRILEAFPKLSFVLLGDNSQSDTQIYSAIANKYPSQIAAIYIRNVEPNKEKYTLKVLNTIENKAISCFQFKHTDEAINHAKQIGLL
jgi:phosphatidate phosphatase APP1